jgi:hypothetical protein
VEVQHEGPLATIQALNSFPHAVFPVQPNDVWQRVVNPRRPALFFKCQNNQTLVASVVVEMLDQPQPPAQLPHRADSHRVLGRNDQNL